MYVHPLALLLAPVLVISGLLTRRHGHGPGLPTALGGADACLLAVIAGAATLATSA